MEENGRCHGAAPAGTPAGGHDAGRAQRAGGEANNAVGGHHQRTRPRGPRLGQPCAAGPSA
eukprot:5154629-Lingulodinium_polyedra.AAC.1